MDVSFQSQNHLMIITNDAMHQIILVNCMEGLTRIEQEMMVKML